MKLNSASICTPTKKAASTVVDTTMLSGMTIPGTSSAIHYRSLTNDTCWTSPSFPLLCLSFYQVSSVTADRALQKHRQESATHLLNFILALFSVCTSWCSSLSSISASPAEPSALLAPSALVTWSISRLAELTARPHCLTASLAALWSACALFTTCEQTSTLWKKTKK